MFWSFENLKLHRFWYCSILIRGKVTIPLVQLSTNCKFGYLWIGKYFLQLVNNQAHSWLTTAHAVLSPSPCMKISLPEQTNCILGIKASAIRSEHSNIHKYKHLNKSNSLQWAYASGDTFYWDKIMTYLALFLANQGKNWQILTLVYDKGSHKLSL